MTVDGGRGGGGLVWVQHDPAHHARTIKECIWIPLGQVRVSAAAPCSWWPTSLNTLQVQEMHTGRSRTPGIWTASSMQGYFPFPPWLQ